MVPRGAGNLFLLHLKDIPEKILKSSWKSLFFVLSLKLLKYKIFFVLNTVNEYHFDLVNYKYRILFVECRLFVVFCSPVFRLKTETWCVFVSALPTSYL